LGVTNRNIEQELVRQFKAGNEMAFELIFHGTKGKLKGFLLRVLPCGEDAESVMQEIYLKLWSGRESINADKNFETYFYAIARNLVIDVMRKRFHKQKYLEELYSHLKEANENSPDPLDTVEYSELERKIFSLIEKLPPKRQAIFRLNKIEGLSYKEIAHRLNISENTVDSQLRQALAFLRAGMKQYFSMVLLIFLNK
jgi:RNA polymerase sigma-70 factor, ECF subfamily